MKRTGLLLCIVTVLASCSNDSGKPTATISNMFTAMKSGNIEEMKKFVTRSDLALLDAGEKLLNSIDPEAIKKIREKMTEEIKKKSGAVNYTLKNEKINGDNATVDAEITADGKTGSHTFELVKEDGDWKIALSKPGNEMFNSMKGNMGPDRGGGLKEGLEKLNRMDPDSLRMLLNKGLQALDSLKNRKDNE